MAQETFVDDKWLNQKFTRPNVSNPISKPTVSNNKNLLIHLAQFSIICVILIVIRPSFILVSKNELEIARISIKIVVFVATLTVLGTMLLTVK